MRDLSWLDEIDEETEAALNPAMRELLQDLRRLRAAQEGQV